MYQITRKLKELTPYSPICGKYKIRLDANESFIKIENSEFIENLSAINLNRYPDPYAKIAVNAFSNFYNVNPDVVTAGNGSDELISIITSSFLEKSDKILVFSPDFSMFSFYSYLFELNVEVMEKDENLNMDIDSVINYINDHDVKCVIFSNPCNPTSLGISKNAISKLLNCKNTLVIVDEAYMDFWDNKESFLAETEKYSNLIVLRTLSKAHAMAGVRLGFAITDSAKTKALRAAKSPYNVNILTQAVCSSILKDVNRAKLRVDVIKKSIKSLYNSFLKENFNFCEKLYETNANFIFVKVKNASEIYDFLLENSICVRLMGDFLRITCGTSEENKILLSTLRKYDEGNENND